MSRTQAVAEPNASTITQQRQISAAEEQDSRNNKGARQPIAEHAAFDNKTSGKPPAIWS